MLLQKTLKWQGRTLDLSKAYKQVPLNENAQAMCVLGYFHKGEWNYYTTSRLPFAATSAVYTFTRISRSIHHILCHFLRVVCTCLYDDFPALSTTFGAALVSKSKVATKDLQNLRISGISRGQFKDRDIGYVGDLGYIWFMYCLCCVLKLLVYVLFNKHYVVY